MAYLQNFNNGLLGNASNLAAQLRQNGTANIAPAVNVKAQMEKMAAQTNAQAQQEMEKIRQQQEANKRMVFEVAKAYATGGASEGASGAEGATGAADAAEISGQAASSIPGVAGTAEAGTQAGKLMDAQKLNTTADQYGWRRNRDSLAAQTNAMMPKNPFEADSNTPALAKSNFGNVDWQKVYNYYGSHGLLS